MPENKCLICYKELDHPQIDYHPKCSKAFFGSATAPELPYGYGDLEKLAGQIVKSSVTVPGVQRKLSLHLDRKGRAGGGRLTLVGLWGSYILKPPTEQYAQLPENEDLVMHLASFFKIDTVPHALIHLKSGELAYISRRIDREKGNKKLHMEDMCQITGRLTEDKYRGSMEQVGKALLRHTSNPLFDATRLLEVALFSYLTGNADMHLKNFSIIRDKKGGLHLAPAYDLLSTRLVIPEKDDPEEMALTLNGKKAKLKRDDFEKFSATIGLNQKQFENILRRFKAAIEPAIGFIQKGLLSPARARALKEIINERAARLGISRSS